MRIRIHVTAKDLAKGTKSCHDACAVAIAVERVVKSKFTVSVTSKDINIYDAGLVAYIENSPRLSQFIMDFDSGEQLKPTTFTLDIDKKFLKPKKKKLIDIIGEAN